MSRSEPTGAASPATRFLEWKAEKGELQYYDKDKKENVPVKLPFSFLVLDEVSQIGGGTKVNGKFEGYWSNAVKNLNTQIITVKSKAGVVAQGLYADLKERKGLHYVKGLYIGFHDENRTLQIGFIKFKGSSHGAASKEPIPGFHDENRTLQIGFIKFKGSSLGAWFEFTKSHRDIYKGAFTIKSRSEVIHGDKGDYYTPVFVYKPDVSEETEAAAIELDKTVQAYLKAYFAHKGVEDEEPEFSGEPKTADVMRERVAAAAPASGGGFNPATDEDIYEDTIPF